MDEKRKPLDGSSMALDDLSTALDGKRKPLDGSSMALDDLRTALDGKRKPLDEFVQRLFLLTQNIKKELAQ